MPVKRTIPGQLREQECLAIELLASLVPENGGIVEVGSLLGLSSWIWAQSAHPSVKVYCIDPWELAGGSNFQKLASEHQQTFTLNQFKQNVKDCPNIVACQGYSPQDFQNWDRKVNLYFEDAVHTDPIFSANLAFWAGHLAADGILCGHDYHPRFPDVQQGAHRYAKQMNRTLRLIGSLWYLLPRDLENSRDPAVMEKLARLNELSVFAQNLPGVQAGEDAGAYMRRVVGGLRSFDYKASLTGAPKSVRQGQPIKLEGVIRNVSGIDWPVILLDKPVLKLGATLEQGGGAKIAASHFHFHRPVWKAGESLEFSLELSTLRAKVAPAAASLDLAYENVAWFAGKGAAPMRISLEIAPPSSFDRVAPDTPIENSRFWKQSVPEYCAESGIGIKVIQQQDYVVPTPDGPIPARSMLTSYELALLYSVARFYCSGAGKIVDLGPLLGVGTNVMARGVKQNPKIKDKKDYIYSYDLFLMENMQHFLPASDSNDIGSVFWRFMQLNREFSDFIRPVPGDFLQMRWNKEPIEVLFIDLAKTWKLNAHVVQNFFSYLIPGRSIVIQQDYVHVGEPWVALQMEVFSEYFDFLYYIYGATAVYRLRKPIPSRILDIDLTAMPLAEIDRYFERAIQRGPASVAEVLKCCQAAIHTERGDLAGASALLRCVDRDVSDPADPSENFIPAIPANLAAATRWFDRAVVEAEAKQAVAEDGQPAPANPTDATQTPPEGGCYTPIQYIQSVYVALLGRNADPTGLEVWLDRLTKEPMHRLPGSLINSAEFQRNYIYRLVSQKGQEAVAKFCNLLSLSSLGKPLHAARCELVAKHLPVGANVLDLGGAAGDEGALLAMGYRGAKQITIIDLPADIRFKPALEKAPSSAFHGTRVEYQYHSMADLSRYADNSFDFIWSGQTIEHVTLAEGDSILRQVARILKPGGVFALDTPNRTLTRLAVGDNDFIHGEHKYEYRYEEFLARHAESGLERIETKGLIAMPRSLSLGYLAPDEIVSGEINDRPEISIVFYVAFRKPGATA